MDLEITENELIKLDKSAVPANTSNATEYCKKKFNEWLVFRDHLQHPCNFETVTPDSDDQVN